MWHPHSNIHQFHYDRHRKDRPTVTRQSCFFEQPKLQGKILNHTPNSCSIQVEPPRSIKISCLTITDVLSNGISKCGPFLQARVSTKTVTNTLRNSDNTLKTVNGLLPEKCHPTDWYQVTHYHFSFWTTNSLFLSATIKISFELFGLASPSHRNF